MHMTTTATGDWLMHFFSLCLYSLVILLFVVNFCVVHVNFRRRFFVPDRIWMIWYEKSAPKVGADFSAPTFGADFWNV